MFRRTADETPRGGFFVAFGLSTMVAVLTEVRGTCSETSGVRLGHCDLAWVDGLGSENESARMAGPAGRRLKHGEART